MRLFPGLPPVLPRVHAAENDWTADAAQAEKTKRNFAKPGVPKCNLGTRDEGNGGTANKVTNITGGVNPILC